MKKLWLLIIAMFLLAASMVHSQALINLAPFSRDLNRFFGGIGEQVTNNFHQTAFASDIIGTAHLGNFPHFTLSFLSVGVTLGPGIAETLNPDVVPPDEWEFSLFPLSGLTDTLMADNEEGQDYIDIATNLFAYPSLSFAVGFGVVRDVDIIVRGFYLPSSFMGFIGDQTGVKELDYVQVEGMNIGGKIRKTFIRDQGWRPAFSIGLGYIYSYLRLGIDDITEFLPETLELAEGQEMALSGNVSYDSNVHTFGMDFHFSKNLFVITPFFKISPYFHITNFTLSTELNADLVVDGNETSLGNIKAGATTDYSLSGEKSYAYISDNVDLSLLFTPGLEINLFVLILHASMTINLESPVLNISEIGSINEITDIAALRFNGIGANIGFRLQI